MKTPSEIRYFDLHCDTATVCCEKETQLCEGDSALCGLERCSFSRYTQLFALFIDEKYRGKAAHSAYKRYLEYLKSEAQRKGFSQYGDGDKKRLYIISLENSTPIEDDPEAAKELFSDGVRVATLTWNGANKLAGGCADGGGLTDAGKHAAGLYFELGIIPDVSHLSDKGFDELAAISDKPLIASHSNLRSVCANRRNLTDAQFGEICRRKGLVGLNLYPVFLSGADTAREDDFLRHLARMLELGGDSVVAIGADLDGAAMPEFFNGISDVPRLYSLVSGRFGTAVADNVFYNNAARFFKRNLMT